MYGCESRNVSSTKKKRLEATEMSFVRSTLTVLWTARRPNTEVMWMAGTETTEVPGPYTEREQLRKELPARHNRRSKSER